MDDTKVKAALDALATLGLGEEERDAVAFALTKDLRARDADARRDAVQELVNSYYDSGVDSDVFSEFLHPPDEFEGVEERIEQIVSIYGPVEARRVVAEKIAEWKKGGDDEDESETESEG